MATLLDPQARGRVILAAEQRARYTLPQDAINALIVAHVRTGAIVVPLKGGDPFIFGRGDADVEAVRAPGLPVKSSDAEDRLARWARVAESASA